MLGREYRRMGGTQVPSGQVWKILSPLGFDPLDRPPKINNIWCIEKYFEDALIFQKSMQMAEHKKNPVKLCSCGFHSRD
jgi:hypothetical protein